MNIDIYAKNMELTPALREFIEEKLTGIEHLLGDAGQSHARVEIGIPSHHHNNSEQKFYAEVNLTVSGHLLRAEATHHDARSAVVDAKDELKIQIKKFKERE